MSEVIALGYLGINARDLGAWESDFEVEFGTNGRAIDESSWVVSHYDEMSCWGHKRSLTDAPVV